MKLFHCNLFEDYAKKIATIITHFSRRGSKVSFMCLRMPAFLSGWDSNTLSNELNSADCGKKKKIIFRKAGWFFKIWEQFWNDFSKTNHTTALAGDSWLVQKSHASFSTNEKQNQSHLVCAIFPALWTSYSKLLGILIGSLCCLLFLWLVKVITFLLVFQSLIENRSIIFIITITWLCKE